VAVPAARVDWHSASSPGRLAASTTGVGAAMPLVSVVPGTSSVAPPSAVRCSTELNERGPVDAPTVVTQGPPWSDVAAPGAAEEHSHVRAQRLVAGGRTLEGQGNAGKRRAGHRCPLTRRS